MFLPALPGFLKTTSERNGCSSMSHELDWIPNESIEGINQSWIIRIHKYILRTSVGGVPLTEPEIFETWILGCPHQRHGRIQHTHSIGQTKLV
jgi:hypothetical protein